MTLMNPVRDLSKRLVYKPHFLLPVNNALTINYHRHVYMTVPDHLKYMWSLNQFAWCLHKYFGFMPHFLIASGIVWSQIWLDFDDSSNSIKTFSSCCQLVVLWQWITVVICMWLYLIIDHMWEDWVTLLDVQPLLHFLFSLNDMLIDRLSLTTLFIISKIP